MSHNIKTSICIMTYNAESTIKKCIQSCINQSCLPYEIVVVDDCSADNTCKVIEGVLSDYAGPISLRFYQNNINLGIARNTKKIIDLAEGDLLYLVAGDDYVLANFIESSVQILDAEVDPNNIFIINDQYEESGDIQVYKRSTYNFSKSILNNAVRKNGSFIKCGVSRNLLKHSDYPDGLGIWADWIWDVDIAIRHKEINVFHNKTPSYVHVGGGGVSSSTPRFEILESYLLSAKYIYSKYHTFFSFFDKLYLLSEIKYFEYVIHGGFLNYLHAHVLFILNLLNYNSIAGLKSAGDRFFPLAKIKRLISK